MSCPWCGGTNTEQDMIDIGVGEIPCGPMGCMDCGAFVPDNPEERNPTHLRAGWFREPDDQSEAIERHLNATTNHL